MGKLSLQLAKTESPARMERSARKKATHRVHQTGEAFHSSAGRLRSRRLRKVRRRDFAEKGSQQLLFSPTLMSGIL